MNLNYLLQRCAELKDLIKIFKNKPIDKNEQSIRKIQLDFLEDNLSDIGRQINNLIMYRRQEDNND